MMFIGGFIFHFTTYDGDMNSELVEVMSEELGFNLWRI